MEKKYIKLARRESRLRAEMKELILSALEENNGKITFTPDDEDGEYPVSASLYGKHDNPVIDISAVYSCDETIYADGYNQSNGVFQTEFIIYPEQYSDILHFIGTVLNWSQGVKSEPIEVTILLGPELINEYENTGKFPSDEWLEDTGGVIDTISYDTEEEMNAFLEGVNFTNGWTDSLVLNESMMEYLNQKREISADEKISDTEIPQKTKNTQYVFVYPVDGFERNMSDEEILSAWENGEAEKYTPDEFAELINDEMFNDIENWVRFIEVEN